MSLCSFSSCRGLSETKEALLCCYHQKVDTFLEESPPPCQHNSFYKALFAVMYKTEIQF